MKFIVLTVAIVAAFSFACTKRDLAKDAYYAQSEACLQSYSTKLDQDSCLVRVRGMWTEAGAPPAAADGGSAVQQ